MLNSTTTATAAAASAPVIEYRTGNYYDGDQVLEITVTEAGYHFHDASRDLTGLVERPFEEFATVLERAGHDLGPFVYGRYSRGAYSPAARLVDEPAPLDERDEAALIQAGVTFDVELDGEDIGGVHYCLALGGWLFTSTLPGCPGRSRTAAPFGVIKSRILKRWSRASVVARAVTS